MITRDHELVPMRQRPKPDIEVAQFIDLAVPGQISGMDQQIPRRDDDLTMQAVGVREGDDPHPCLPFC